MFRIFSLRIFLFFLYDIRKNLVFFLFLTTSIFESKLDCVTRRKLYSYEVKLELFMTKMVKFVRELSL